MIEIQVKDNTDEGFAKALKLFKKKCNNEGFLREIRDRRYFKKPSEKRHEKIGQIKRLRKKQVTKKIDFY